MALFLDTPIAKYAQRLVALEGQQGKTFKIVLDTKFIKDLIIFLNTDTQMGKEHVDSLGQELFNSLVDRTTYSLFDKKGRGGKQYKLFDTGQFWESFKVQVNESEIVINSNPIKGSDNLFDIYGKDIVGLTEDSLNILINESLKQFIQYYEKTLLPK